MKKFVRYLYAYRNGKRIQNVGFVKCEESTERMVLQIYGKGFPVNGNDRYELFVFYPQEDTCVGISMGTLQNTSPVFSYRLEYDVNDVDGRENFDKVKGIILVKGQGSKKNWYAAKWEEDSLNIEQMIRREEMPVEEEPQEMMTVVAEEEPQEVVDAVIEEEPAEVMTVVAEEESQEVVDAVIEEEPAEMMTAVTEKELAAACVETEEAVAEKDLIYKITRQDLAKLPRCEWKLANNHFLLHGYHNYHHLVSFEKEGVCWLGVPGVFHPNEQRVAQAFGFGQFMRPDEGEIELLPEQKEDDEEFGYWCRNVSSVIEE